MNECAFCGKSMANGTESLLIVSEAAESTVKEDLDDYRLEDRRLLICPDCITGMVEDYIYTSE